MSPSGARRAGGGGKGRKDGTCERERGSASIRLLRSVLVRPPAGCLPWKRSTARAHIRGRAAPTSEDPRATSFPPRPTARDRNPVTKNRRPRSCRAPFFFSRETRVGTCAPSLTAAISVFRDRLDFPQQCVAGIDGYRQPPKARKTGRQKEGRGKTS